MSKNEVYIGDYMLNEPEYIVDVNKIEKLIRYPRNEAEYNRLLEILDELIDHDGDPVLMERIAVFIEQYDDLHYPIGVERALENRLERIKSDPDFAKKCADESGIWDKDGTLNKNYR